MAESKKYTLGESAFILAGVPVAMGVLFAVIVVPLTLFYALLRMVMWNWFMVPYLHAPQMTIWLMLAISIVIGSFRSSYPALKPEMYAEKAAWKRLLSETVVSVVAFITAYILHLTMLKG